MDQRQRYTGTRKVNAHNNSGLLHDEEADDPAETLWERMLERLARMDGDRRASLEEPALILFRRH
jgi:hypothetical protein